MKLDKIRRLAAQILKVGENKIWINPEMAEKASEAMTKEDVRGLIKERIVGKKKAMGHSRGSARILAEKKRKGRKKGRGKKTGTKKARMQKKKTWMANVRAQRKLLNEIKEKGLETEISYREIYNKIRGGYFKGKKYINALVKEKKEKGESK